MKRTKITCELCNVEYSKSNFARHYDKCSGKNSYVFPPKTEIWRLAMKKKGGKNQFTKAKELGLPVPVGAWAGKVGPNKGIPLTEEHKQKISKSRIKFLKENPDKVPYKLNHYSKGRSYAEEYWKTILDSNDLIYEEQHRIGTYQLDFAFLDKKIDLEIDGDQHHLDPRIVKSDIRRNEYLKQLDWTVIRIKWSDYQKLTNKKEFVDNILSQINDAPVGQ